MAENFTFTHWVIFNVVLAFLLILDLKILTRNSREVSMKQAAWLTAFWWGVAIVCGIWIFADGSADQGISYATAFVVEKALSVDNLFVFLVIFTYFGLPDRSRLRALFFGIIGALIARAIFIAIGLSIISAFSWVLFLLGAFLVYTGYKIAFLGDTDKEPGRQWREALPQANLFEQLGSFIETEFLEGGAHPNFADLAQ